MIRTTATNNATLPRPRPSRRADLVSARAPQPMPNRPAIPTRNPSSAVEPKTQEGRPIVETLAVRSGAGYARSVDHWNAPALLTVTVIVQSPATLIAAE